ncbi:ceramidase domain-containing protein [Catelliglobosispora koreensis]|uniref:ceramidase domain-containing protein n=1 Tax=Catelliglobosispora koreensis TaxID=129052 RepID=UPI00039EB8AF|nr:ceramidase domain-containing protein [Catelliglobosispora koreensis]
MRRNLTPIVITAATAVVSCALLALAVWQGWLGPDVGRGANFCEAARDALVRQPANTFSNAGFVAAGLLIAWHAGARARLGRMATFYACVVVLLGPASAAMHATQSANGGHLDMLSMYLVASFIFAYAAKRWFRGGWPLFAALFVVGIAFCELAGLWSNNIPIVGYSGNAAFGLLLLAATVLEALIMRRGETSSARGFAFASLGALLVAFAIWNATKDWLCAPHSFVQGHAIWHLLCALAAYLLYHYYDSEKAAA